VAGIVILSKQGWQCDSRNQEADAGFVQKEHSRKNVLLPEPEALLNI
jgi:hypothetical protein